MIILILGLLLFLGVHLVSVVNEPWRNGMAARLGEWRWKGIYSVVSLAGFILIVVGYGLAGYNPVVLYVPPVWLRHLAVVLLVPVFPLLLAAYLPGRIQAHTKHPMLAATKLWALAHLLANGMLADVALFGSVLGWAVVVRISMKRRTPRALPAAPAGRFNDILAVVGGLVLFVLFLLWLHRLLIGVSPFGHRF